MNAGPRATKPPKIPQRHERASASRRFATVRDMAEPERTIQVIQVDERDSGAEDPDPRFRVYLHASGATSTAGSTDTYDITGADVHRFGATSGSLRGRPPWGRAELPRHAQSADAHLYRRHGNARPQNAAQHIHSRATAGSRRSAAPGPGYAP